MHSVSDNIEIMINDEADEVIKVLFDSLRNRYHIRDRPLSMQEGGWRVFVGAMKNFRHILMGPEKFLKIFGGVQNIYRMFCFINFSF